MEAPLLQHLYTMDTNTIIIICIAVSALFLLTIFSSLFIVRQQTVLVIERFGRFLRAARAGLHFKIPLIDVVRGTMNLRVQQLDFVVETNSKDNVFVDLFVSVQFCVLPDKIYEAFYKLENPDAQIKAYIFDIVRASVPHLILDDVFAKKDEIALKVKEELHHVMEEFGYSIIQTLVTDVQPDEGVKRAMNEINASQRMRIAAQEKGEADKILRVKHAEAEAEANILHGKGIAGQRAAIIDGLAHSLEELKRAAPGLNNRNVMEMVLVIQYFDMLRDVGGSSKSNTIFMEHSPGGIADVATQIRNVIFAPKPDDQTLDQKLPEVSSPAKGKETSAKGGKNS